MHMDRKLRCNLCKHIWQGNVSKAARHFVQKKRCHTTMMDMLVDIWNGRDYTFASENVSSILSYMEDKGIRDARSVMGRPWTRVPPSTTSGDEVQDVLDEADERKMCAQSHEGAGLSGGVDFKGEEVVLTLCGAGPKEKGKRKVVDGDGVPTAPGKRVRKSWIDEVYNAEKLSKFCDKFLQWVYDVDISFNAFKRPPWRKRAKVATLLREVREAFVHSGVTMLSDDKKSRDARPIVNFLAVGANGALLYSTICHDGLVRETGAIVHRSSTHVCNLMLSDIGTRVEWARDTIICARALVRFIKSHGAVLALYKRKSSHVSPIQPVETRFASFFFLSTCLAGRRNTLQSMLHDNEWASIPWERSLLPQAQWVCLQIRDSQFWRLLEFAILMMEPVHQLSRRMDRGGMMMSILYEWSQHLVRLMKQSTVPPDLLSPCVREVEMRLMHLLEPAHAAAHLPKPRRQSMRYYEFLHTTPEDAEVVQECDRFLLAQTGGDPTGRDYLLVREQIRRFHTRRGDWGDRLLCGTEAPNCDRDDETTRCAVWWFAHWGAHPELRAITIHVMHMWTPASPPERNWAEHERIHTTKRNKLGFAKVAQLVEIMTNRKLASCRQHGVGYVLPWIMDGHEDTRPHGPTGEDEEDADPEPEAWGARPAGTVSDAELRRQVDVFARDDTTRPREMRVVFWEMAAILLPFVHVPPPAQDTVVEGLQAGEDDWTDPEDLASGGDRSAKQV
ncbi:hypothetical protein CBR_g30538 [Chara braunii]|uniref:DUF659 domain-containing protein n=1 Tax=Chara braunii TaxID=69332 RepID=A0A388LD87_CHABU|nr:hypothetical protein CBR_g30538 [Chara braunii]|eukprot:GBG80172.1 hypothetical protein CBR_g30538 [Chara braunii]